MCEQQAFSPTYVSDENYEQFPSQQIQPKVRKEQKHCPESFRQSFDLVIRVTGKSKKETKRN